MREPVYRLSIRINRRDKQTLLLFLWFSNLVTLTVARYALSLMGFNSGITRTIVLWLVASVPLFMYIVYNRSAGYKNATPFVCLFLAVVFAWLFTALVNPSVRQFLTRESYGPDRIFRPDAPMFAFLFFMMFDDPKKLLKNVTVYAYIFFVYEIVVSYIPAMSRGYWINIGASGQELHLNYSLSFGYSMCFPLIVFMYNSFKDRKLVHILMAIASLWFVLTNGNRGAVLIPIVYVALKIISGIEDNRSLSNKIIKVILVLLGCVVVYLLGEYILDIIVSALSKTEISSRNIQKLAQGSFTNDNGRSIIWMTSLQAIKSGGLFGYGVYGDRPFISRIHYVGYSHNLFLELLVSFGIIGVMIIIYIIYNAVYMLFSCKDPDWRELYIIFFAISCQLLLSLSFWYVWEFWAAVAIAYRYRHLRKARSLLVRRNRQMRLND